MHDDHTCPSFTWPWMHMGQVFCTVPTKPLTSTTAAASNSPERVHLQHPRVSVLRCCWHAADAKKRTLQSTQTRDAAIGMAPVAAAAYRHSDRSLVCKDSARDSNGWVLHAMAAFCDSLRINIFSAHALKELTCML